MEAILSAILLVVQSKEDDRKQSGEFVFLKKESPPIQGIDPNSKIQRIYHSPSSLTIKTARSPAKFRPVYSSPPVYSLSPPPSSKQRKKHNFISDTPRTVLLPNSLL